MHGHLPRPQSSIIINHSLLLSIYIYYLNIYLYVSSTRVREIADTCVRAQYFYIIFYIYFLFLYYIFYFLFFTFLHFLFIFLLFLLIFIFHFFYLSFLVF